MVSVLTSGLALVLHAMKRCQSGRKRFNHMALSSTNKQTNNVTFVVNKLTPIVGWFVLVTVNDDFWLPLIF
jgi:hypothetical protein